MSHAALRALAEALEAGLTPRTIVDDKALAAAMPPPIRTALRKSASTSTALGDALRETDALDDGPAAIVVAGERAGFLPRALRLAADAVAAAQKRRRRALLALAYPAFLVVAGGCVLPLPLIFSKGFDAYLAAAGPFVATTVVVVVAVFVVLPRMPVAFRARIDAIVARVPFIGTVIVEDARGAFFEILGALLSAGAPMTSSLPAAVRAAGLSSWSAGRIAAEQSIAKGGTLSDALLAGGFVDEARAGRVAIAERSGALDKALPALGKEARERAQGRFTALVVVIGLVVFGAVAVGIGVSVVGGFQAYMEQIDRATAE